MTGALIALGCLGLAAIGVLGVLDQARRTQAAVACLDPERGRTTALHGRHRR
jgi:hypothetical protein